MTLSSFSKKLYELTHKLNIYPKVTDDIFDRFSQQVIEDISQAFRQPSDLFNLMKKHKNNFAEVIHYIFNP